MYFRYTIINHTRNTVINIKLLSYSRFVALMCIYILSIVSSHSLMKHSGNALYLIHQLLLRCLLTHILHRVYAFLNHSES